MIEWIRANPDLFFFVLICPPFSLFIWTPVLAIGMFLTWAVKKALGLPTPMFDERARIEDEIARRHQRHSSNYW